jgi:predicted nucleic-acid-binding Zn-ribbon protein
VSEVANEETVSELAELFKQSFPDARCLRCGSEDFYVLPSARQAFLMGEPEPVAKWLGVVTLACARCGYVEQHLSAQLRKAIRPIENVKPVDSP